MAVRVVLVTGASRLLGSRLAGALAADDRIERVIGVDTVSPGPEQLAVLGRTEFVRADIRNPLIARVVDQAGVDTVVHMNVLATPGAAGGRTAMKEINVIGTMQLLAACQRAESVAKLVVKSSTAVYGSSPRDPALFEEDGHPRAAPRSGFGKDAIEVEGYVRGFARRRPDVALTLLRFANFLGPTIDTPLSRYLSLPVVPTVLGYDPRLQLCHEDDAVEALRRAVFHDALGTANVAGAGVLLLSQALRRLRRPSLPLPTPLLAAAATGLRGAGGVLEPTREQLHFLEHGRVVDVARLTELLGWQPRSTAETFASFADAGGRASMLPAVAAGAARFGGALGGALAGGSSAGRSVLRSAGRRPGATRRGTSAPTRPAPVRLVPRRA